jgi:hypothetical protein
MRPETQTERLVRYLRLNPGATSLEVTMACGIVNVTGRVSDAREEGHLIDCRRGKDGRFHYWIREESQQLGWTA